MHVHFAWMQCHAYKPDCASIPMIKRTIRRRARSTRRRTYSTRAFRTLEKLAKASRARSQQARMNYIIDALHESGRIDSRQDKFMHLVNEMMTGSGTATGALRALVEEDTKIQKIRPFANGFANRSLHASYVGT